jgi:hypothetical protein
MLHEQQYMEIKQLQHLSIPGSDTVVLGFELSCRHPAAVVAGGAVLVRTDKRKDRQHQSATLM